LKILIVSKLKFILLFYFISLFNVITGFYILKYFNFEMKGNPIFEYEIILIFILGSVISPIFETYLIQLFVYKSFKYSIKVYFENISNQKNSLISIFLTSLIFGLLHFYSIGYVILMFCLGIILSLVFYLSELRNENAIANTIIIHSLYNTTLIIISVII
jgi:hypothetical protein